CRKMIAGFRSKACVCQGIKDFKLRLVSKKAMPDLHEDTLARPNGSWRLLMTLVEMPGNKLLPGARPCDEYKAPRDQAFLGSMNTHLRIRCSSLFRVLPNLIQRAERVVVFKVSRSFRTPPLG